MSTPDSLSELIERLKLAETRLETNEARLKEVTSQRNDLKRSLTAAEKKLEKLESSAAEAKRMLEEQERVAAEQQRLLEEERQKAEASDTNLNGQVTALINENRRLAEELEGIRSSVDKFSIAMQEKDEQIVMIKAESDAVLKRETAALQEKFAAERKRYDAHIADLSRQVQTQGKLVTLTPERAADLLNRLVDQMRLTMPTLSPSSGELRLKVAFAGTGTTAGFIIPTPDSPPEVRSSLQEITLRFDKTHA